VSKCHDLRRECSAEPREGPGKCYYHRGKVQLLVHTVTQLGRYKEFLSYLYAHTGGVEFLLFFVRQLCVKFGENVFQYKNLSFERFDSFLQ